MQSRSDFPDSGERKSRNSLPRAATFSGTTGPFIADLSVATLAARVCQSVVHIAFVETARTVSVRFTFFAVQIFAMLGIAFAVVGGG